MLLDLGMHVLHPLGFKDSVCRGAEGSEDRVNTVFTFLLLPRVLFLRTQRRKEGEDLLPVFLICLCQRGGTMAMAMVTVVMMGAMAVVTVMTMLWCCHGAFESLTTALIDSRRGAGGCHLVAVTRILSTMRNYEKQKTKSKLGVSQSEEQKLCRVPECKQSIRTKAS